MRWAVPRIPGWIETNHLTLTTLLWSGLVILFGYLAVRNRFWLIGTSLCLFFQYITDVLDGAVGRYRGTGLVKWGYYMDHMFDYLFACSILISYSFILPPEKEIYLFSMLAVFGAYMVNTYLLFGVTNRFVQYYFKFGPTELRLVLIVANLMIVFFGKTYLAWALPYVLAAALLGLVWLVHKTQKELWEIDKENIEDE